LDRLSSRNFGPFVLTRRIAQGGDAEVFLAKPSRGLAPAPVLVIKCPRTGRSPHEAFELLRAEADLHQAAAHPAVVRVYGAGMIGSEPYLALEHVDGVNLHQLSSGPR
jgi:serine/threonine protein kinase